MWVRHKCGAAAAQSRTKNPDFCTLDPYSAACGLKFYPVCSEALRSPLPLITNSVTVPFSFWCIPRTPRSALNHLFSLNKHHKVRTADTFFALYVTSHIANYHPCIAKHIDTLWHIWCAQNSYQHIAKHYKLYQQMYVSFQQVFNNFNVHYFFLFLYNYLFLYIYLFLYYLLLSFSLLTISYTKSYTISYLISDMISELKSWVRTWCAPQVRT